jgi:hypothetical protein
MSSRDFQYNYKQNKYFLKYAKQRDKIREKYEDLFWRDRAGHPAKNARKYTQQDHERYKKYLKQIADLMFKPNGWFQKFYWDALSEQDKEIMERKARGRLNGSKFL